MRTACRIASLLAAVAVGMGAMPGVKTAAAQEQFVSPGEATVCFAQDGEADYTYQDAGLSVAIKRYDEDEIVFFVCDIQLSDASHIRTALSGDKVYGKTE